MSHTFTAEHHSLALSRHLSLLARWRHTQERALRFFATREICSVIGEIEVKKTRIQIWDWL